MERLLEKTKRAVKRLLSPAPDPQTDEDQELPGDPYAYVGAPKKPRPSLRSGAVALEEPE
jgi:hypothetical protein